MENKEANLDFRNPIEGETAQAFEAFQMFCEYRKPRNQRRFCRENGLNYKTVNMWANKYNWYARIIAFDKSIQRLTLDNTLEEIKRFKERLLLDMQEDYEDMRDLMKKQMNSMLDSDDPDPKGVKDLINVQSALLSLGQNILDIAGVKDKPKSAEPKEEVYRLSANGAKKVMNGGDDE